MEAKTRGSGYAKDKAALRAGWRTMAWRSAGCAATRLLPPYRAPAAV